jgi:hypothetical protein
VKVVVKDGVDSQRGRHRIAAGSQVNRIDTTLDVVVTGSQQDRESIEYRMSRRVETVCENVNNDE